MLQKVYVVVGMGYGDEGKGLTTDYLCSKSDNPLVVRFNGGHQAGHTVVLPDGRMHIFACFGAGTLRGTPTYWSNYCTFSPSVLLAEYKELIAISVEPVIYIDNLCPVTTHYDILYNRAIEATRDSLRHGSCGVGFGATIERHHHSPIKLYAQDLLFPSMYVNKLKAIKSYYMEKINSETFFDFQEFNHDKEDLQFSLLIDSLNELIQKKIINLCNSNLINNNRWSTIIFEGAQGILLDMNFGVYPHVTRSNSTSANAMKIIKDNLSPDIPIEIVYVTRCYQTRHGAGPFKRNSSLRLYNNNETNKYNEHQGDFYIDYLDIDNLNYALKCDSNFTDGASKNLIITCLDHIDFNSVKCKHGELLINVSYKQIPELLDCSFDSVRYSFSNVSEKIK